MSLAQRPVHAATHVTKLCMSLLRLPRLQVSFWGLSSLPGGVWEPAAMRPCVRIRKVP